MKGYLLVFNEGFWYVRSVASVMHDLDRDEKVYRCDGHVGGPYNTLEEATKAKPWLLKLGK
jgi:hypothetical protein